MKFGRRRHDESPNVETVVEETTTEPEAPTDPPPGIVPGLGKKIVQPHDGDFSDKDVDDDYGYKGPLSFARADEKTTTFARLVVTLKWNAFPLGLLMIDILLSVGGFAAIFKPAIDSSDGWTKTGIMVSIPISSFVLSGAQMYAISMIKTAFVRIKKKRSGQKINVSYFGLAAPPIFLLSFWLMDQLVDWIGYTYMTTGNQEWAMNVLPPGNVQTTGWLIGGWFVWACAFVSEFVFEHKARIGSR
ncbi:MAG: hypothetical protein PVI21_03400 [Candidatus Woesebacteria bacterium]